jgi:ribulose-5-phosphate 4-epimerase/fuculose-1-phosphate aldolase
VFFEDHVVVTKGGGEITLDEAGAKTLAAELGPHKAVIHQNHGLFTVGHSVDEAVFWLISMERSCQAQLLAEAAGKPHLIAAKSAAFTRDQTGSHLAGWFSYQPLWQEIVRSDPDLFD